MVPSLESLHLSSLFSISIKVQIQDRKIACYDSQSRNYEQSDSLHKIIEEFQIFNLLQLSLICS